MPSPLGVLNSGHIATHERPSNKVILAYKQTNNNAKAIHFK